MPARSAHQDTGSAGVFKPELEPGKGLGGICLGARVQEILAIMQRHPEVFSNVAVKFAEDGSSDLLIECPDIGLNVICRSRDQRVRLLELYRPRDFTVLFCDVPCCGPSLVPTFPAIYHRLGPAMPGSYRDDMQMYFLEYPGVTFMFPIPREFAHNLNLTGKLPDGTTPVAARMLIHPVHDVLGNAPPPLPPDCLYMEPVRVTLDGTMTFEIRGCHLDCRSSTPQDVVGQLGPPSSIMQKRVDKLRIHAKQTSGCAQYFFNYRDLGIDILFDARQHTIRKLLMHTNCPEHVDFNDYSKCNFRLALPGRKVCEDASVDIGPDTRWAEIESIMGVPEGGKPLIHADSALEPASGHSLFYGYKVGLHGGGGVIFEVTHLGNLATVIIYRN